MITLVGGPCPLCLEWPRLEPQLPIYRAPSLFHWEQPTYCFQVQRNQKSHGGGHRLRIQEFRVLLNGSAQVWFELPIPSGNLVCLTRHAKMNTRIGSLGNQKNLQCQGLTVQGQLHQRRKKPSLAHWSIGHQNQTLKTSGTGATEDMITKRI
jgi:hypothetical protein